MYNLWVKRQYLPARPNTRIAYPGMAAAGTMRMRHITEKSVKCLSRNQSVAWFKSRPTTNRSGALRGTETLSSSFAGWPCFI